MRVVRRHERKARLLRDAQQAAVDLTLLRNAVVLQLQIEMLRAENAGKLQYSSSFHGMHHKRGPVLGYHADAARQKTQIYWEVNPLCLKELYSTRPALSWQP